MLRSSKKCTHEKRVDSDQEQNFQNNACSLASLIQLHSLSIQPFSFLFSQCNQLLNLSLQKRANEIVMKNGLHPVISHFDSRIKRIAASFVLRLPQLLQSTTETISFSLVSFFVTPRVLLQQKHNQPILFKSRNINSFVSNAIRLSCHKVRWKKSGSIEHVFISACSLPSKIHYRNDHCGSSVDVALFVTTCDRWPKRIFTTSKKSWTSLPTPKTLISLCSLF